MTTRAQTTRGQTSASLKGWTEFLKDQQADSTKSQDLRRRILADTAISQQRSKKRWQGLVVFAFLLGTPVAIAAASHPRVVAWWSSLTELVSSAQTSPRNASNASKRRNLRSSAPAKLPVASSAVAPHSNGSSKRHTSAITNGKVPGGAPIASDIEQGGRAADQASVTPEQQRRYQLAHDAQFRHKDWLNARYLWSTFLTRYPDAVLTPEARYNFAIVLLHLGDDAQATLELNKCLQSVELSYRHDEVRALLKKYAGEQPTDRH